jgi:hypothetical protein
MRRLNQQGRSQIASHPVLLAVVLLSASFALPARAADVAAPSVSITGVNQTSSLTVSVTGAMIVESIDLTIEYDSAVVLVTGDAAPTGLAASCMASTNFQTPGVVNVGIACVEPLDGDGDLFTLPLRSQSYGSSALTITRCDLNEGATPCSASAGSVSVIAPTATATGTSTATATPTATPTSSSTATASPTAAHTGTSTATATVTNTPTVTGTPTSTPTVTQTRSSTPTGTATRTFTATATVPPSMTPTPLPPLTLDPLASPIVVGASQPVTGTGFSPGSVVVLFIALSSGVQSSGPYFPTSVTPTSLTWQAPVSIPLGNGFATMVIVNTDQGYRQSNGQSQLLFGDPAANIPTITAVNGVALTPASPAAPLAFVETFVAKGSTVTLTGTGFNGALVNLFTSTGNAGPLTPLAGASATQLQVVVPGSAPTGPGSFQVVNSPYAGNVVSNAVSVPIGASVTVSGVTQNGSIVTVNGTGFSVLTVINLFNKQGVGGVNLGGLKPDGSPQIPLTLVSDTQFTFAVPSAAVTGPAYVQVLNPPFIASSSSGNDPDGAFLLTAP